MEYTKKISQNQLVVEMIGHFTYGDREKFNEVLKLVETCTSPSFVLDLAQTASVDSSSLGYLVILRDAAQKKKLRLILQNPSKALQGIFRVSDFYKIFEIQEDGASESKIA